ncbi:C40 family peptidase [Vaginella massiliensis]|uniref:C40 family peptidase n=1 Tax=Vaginella massiliensis TaxID=1816680 RepID=UPI000837BCAB|nr:C40 family peptidase [Vaginella massiliensis]
MKSKLIGAIAGIFTLILTSCGTTANITDHNSSHLANRSFAPQAKFFNAQNKLINKRAIEVSPIKIKQEFQTLAVLNTIVEETNTIFTDLLLKEAETYLGTPYRYGGTTRRGIDCSAFVRNVFSMFNKELPRVSADQAKEGFRVSTDELKEGDLVFFATKGRGRVTHVGIVHGKNEDGVVQFIHSSTSKGVVITPITDSYWGKRFLYAKRIL